MSDVSSSASRSTFSTPSSAARSSDMYGSYTRASGPLARKGARFESAFSPMRPIPTNPIVAFPSSNP